MKCTQCSAELAADAKFCSQCGERVPSNPSGVNTGGGAYFGGPVNAGGHVVARDFTVHGGYQQTTYTGLQGDDLARFGELYGAVYRQIERRTTTDADAEPELLKETARKIEQEAAKGDKADENVIRRSLTTLSKLAPDVVDVAVNALTNPGAAVASGVRLIAKTFARTPEPVEETTPTASS